jgi:hypothetical protein
MEVYAPDLFVAEHEHFAGLRGVVGPSEFDIQHRSFGPIIMTRLRKTF